MILPNSKFRKIFSKLNKLRGGQVLELLIVGNEIYAFVDGIIGFVSFLGTLPKPQLRAAFKKATTIRAMELSLMSANAGIPINKLKDITCVASFRRKEKISRSVLWKANF